MFFLADMVGEATSAGDVRKACLDILTSCLSSNNNSKEVVKMLPSAKRNENSASTISF